MKSFISACVFGFLCVAVFGVQDASAQKKKKKEDSTPPPRKEDVPRLINTLTKGTNGSDRAFAAQQIGRLGQIQAGHVKEAVEPLLEAMKKDSDAGVRRSSAEALGKIAPNPDKVVPALMEALKDKAIEVNLAAVTALGRYGPEARAALPALRDFAKTKGDDKKIKQMVGAAMKEINKKL